MSPEQIREYKTFLLTIPSETWASFKGKVTKDITLNNKIISLIEGYIEGHINTPEEIAKNFDTSDIEIALSILESKKTEEETK